MASLVGQIYDCVDDEDQWEGVIEKLYKAFGCSGASFQAQGSLAGVPECAAPFGVAQEAFDAYRKQWITTDIMITAFIKRLMQVPPHLRTTPVTFNTIFDDERFWKSEIYHEFYCKYEMSEFLALPFDFTSQFCGIGLWRGNGKFSDEQIAIAEFISPHIVRAKSLSNRLRYSRAFTKNGNFNSISNPVFLICQHCNLLERNGAAGALLEMGDTVLLEKNALKFRDDVMNQRLIEAIRYLTTFEPTQYRQTQFSSFDGATITLSELVVPPRVKQFSVFQREFAVSIEYPKASAEGVIVAAEHRFGLTKTEREIVSMLAQGTPVRAISQRRRTKVSTTRWHIKQIFAKTGASSQSELLLKLMVH